jgi:methylthioribose-1-phosphate isomerase
MEAHISFDPALPALRLRDQRLLPEQEAYILCRTPEDVIEALRSMAVRGAPAIGVAAAWGCALALHGLAPGADWPDRLDAALENLAQARPTAVNLRWAVERMRARWRRLGKAANRETLHKAFMDEARRMQEEDVAACKALGRYGAALLKDGDTVLTHCNAGALATAGYGTALGVVRAAVAAGKRIRVIADETRPFLQGARLPAWVLHEAHIPVAVACDHACALLMHKGLVQCVVVGADRIAANGDTANKIGTLGVALLARHFGIPFYVAAPLSTIDPATPHGDAIPIEERPAAEVTHMGARRLCPEGVPVYNFAFDVTPAACITGIITEQGVLRPPYGLSIWAACNDTRTNRACDAAAGAVSPAATDD